MPVVKLPTITGPLWQIREGKYAPRSLDHITTAIHEAGHFTIANHTPHAVPWHCWVHCKPRAKRQIFSGASATEWWSPRDYPAIEEYRSRTMWTVGGYVAERAVFKHLPNAGGNADWRAKDEFETAIGKYIDVMGIDAARRLITEAKQLLNANFVYFQRIFARLLIPAHVGRYGRALEGGYYGICSSAAAAIEEWQQATRNAEFSPDWSHFANTWASECHITAEPADPDKRAKYRERMLRQADDDFHTSGVGQGLSR